MLNYNNFYFFIPELYFFFNFFILIFFFSIFKKFNDFIILNKFNFLTIIFLIFTLILYVKDYQDISCYSIYLYNFFFKKTQYSIFCNIFILILTIIYFIYIQSNNNLFNKINYYFEYTIILLFVISGILLLLSVNDLLLFYINFELISLSLYLLIAFNINSTSAINSSITYYILGAIASTLILLGIILVYALSGTTNFNNIILLIPFFIVSSTYYKITFFVSIIFIFIGLFFKLGIFPFHFWIAEIYSGISYKTMLFLFLIPKSGFFFFFINLYYNVFYDFLIYTSYLLLIVGLFSIGIGTFCALNQKNIKKLLAFSSIVNVGYILIVLSTVSIYSIIYVFIYLFVYFLNLFIFFFSILLIKKIVGFQELNISYITQFSNLFKTNPILAFILSTSLFSIAGLPPFGGFYVKYLILIDLINNDLFIWVFLILLINIIATFYYIRIIKIIFFNKNLNLKTTNLFLINENISVSVFKWHILPYITSFLMFLFMINILILFYPSILYYIFFSFLFF